ncbi:MAG: type II secretion system F family protein, partial [Oscillibacter sp.]|nr:type II secretion system F family protein [Oscillibacter sp.]
MAQYKYTGIARQGGRVSGTLEASSREEALLRVRDTCQVVLSLKRSLLPRKGSGSAEEDGKSRFGDMGGSRLNLKTFAMMCRQISISLDGGMRTAQAVGMAAEAVPDRCLRRWLKEVRQDVESGASLADSMAGRRAAFLPAAFLETVRAGEASGTLGKTFADLSRHYERQYKTRSQLRSAMAYPAFLLAAGTVVMGVILLYAVPAFTQALEQAGTEAPPLTRLVIRVSRFVQLWWRALVLGTAGLFALFRLLDGVPRFHLLSARLQLRLPVLGKLAELSAASRFITAMAALAGSGMPIPDAVETASGVIDNAFLRGKAAEMVPLLRQGLSLSDSLYIQNLFPHTLAEMLAIGENSGEMESALACLSRCCEEELDAASASAVKKLTLAALIAAGGLVLLMLGG